MDGTAEVAVRGSTSARDYSKKSFNARFLAPPGEDGKRKKQEVPFLGAPHRPPFWRRPSMHRQRACPPHLHRPSNPSTAGAVARRRRRPRPTTRRFLYQRELLNPGFPSDDRFVLHGPENDRTLGLRNWLALGAARAAGRYASRTAYFELFLVQARFIFYGFSCCS